MQSNAPASPATWSNGTISIRLADRSDLPDIAEMLEGSPGETTGTEVRGWKVLRNPDGHELLVWGTDLHLHAFSSHD